jgi:hypothetical protein
LTINSTVKGKESFSMSLTRKPEMTPEKIAANQNAHLSRGPATPEGMERLRDANTRHGFYSQAEGEALRALGWRRRWRRGRCLMPKS